MFQNSESSEKIIDEGIMAPMEKKKDKMNHSSMKLSDMQINNTINEIHKQLLGPSLWDFRIN